MFSHPILFLIFNSILKILSLLNLFFSYLYLLSYRLSQKFLGNPTIPLKKFVGNPTIPPKKICGHHANSPKTFCGQPTYLSKTDSVLTALSVLRYCAYSICLPPTSRPYFFFSDVRPLLTSTRRQTAQTQGQN